MSDDDRQFVRDAVKETVRACYEHNALPAVTIIANPYSDDPPVVIDHAGIGEAILRKFLSKIAASEKIT